jgi:hypothetical protein
MYISDKELNKIVSENIQKYLNEAPTNKPQNNSGNKNAGANTSTAFNDEYLNKNKQNRPASVGAQIAKTAGKGVAAYAGAQLGSGVLSGMMDLASGAGRDLAGVLTTVGLGGLAIGLINSITALNRAKKLQFPRLPMNAMKYGKYAAAERAIAQNKCKIIQTNIQNAIAAYNKQFNQELDTNDQNTFGYTTAQYQDRGQQKDVDVDFDRDFTNINAGQNESLNNNTNLITEAQEPTIKSAQDFLQDFSNMSQQEALQVIEVLKQSYSTEYGVWFQWTRYINVLVQKFSKFGLTWEMVINSNKTSSAQSIISSFLKEKFGIESGDNVNDYQGKNETLKITARVKSLNYNQKYILFKDENSPSYYCLRNDIFKDPQGKTKQPYLKDESGKEEYLTKECRVQIFVSPKLKGKTFKSTNGYQVQQLLDIAVNKMLYIADF